MSEWPSWLPIRDELRELSPYGAPQLDVPVRLNTNENPYQLSEPLQQALERAIASTLRNLNRYPDRDAIELRSQLARSITESTGVALDQSWVWPANGSNEIIQSIYLAFAGDALGFEPSYSMHPLIARTVGKKWHSISRDANFQIDLASAAQAINSSSARLVFLTTPNNPTGGATSIEEIRELAAVTAQCGAILIVDEAYAEFSSERSAVTLIKEFPNLLVSRTMSKAFAFAGARLGYLIANPKVIEAMLLVRLPYHLSALTQSAALGALCMRSELGKDVIGLRESRDLLAAELRNLGLSVLPSQANFLLFGGFKMPAAELWQALVSRGVLIRDVGIAGHLRVTVGTRAENRAFLDALSELVRG